VYEAPRGGDAIQKETAETLLRKLIEQNDPRHAPPATFCRHARSKRVLKVKEQIRRDGKRTFIYEQPRTGDIFTSPIRLHLDQLEQVQRDVAALLERGLTRRSWRRKTNRFPLQRTWQPRRTRCSNMKTPSSEDRTPNVKACV